MKEKGYVFWRHLEPNDVFIHPSMTPKVDQSSISG